MVRATKWEGNRHTNQTGLHAPTNQTAAAVPSLNARYKRKALLTAVRRAGIRLGIGAFAIAVLSLAAAEFPWNNSGPSLPMWVDALLAVPVVGATVVFFLRNS